jgi:hypothetical protein
MSLLDFKNKWTIQTSERFVPRAAESPAKFASIESPGFQKWSNVNMYRTSYNDMSNKVSGFLTELVTFVCDQDFNQMSYVGYSGCQEELPHPRVSRLYPCR